MTTDKNTWSKLSKKYPTKASWVRALNDLSWGEHDELFSALIDLDISDLASESRADGLSGQVDREVNLHLHNHPMDDDEEITAAVNRALSRLD